MMEARGDAAVIRVNWDIEECVALIDLYHRCHGKAEKELKSELQYLSDCFHRRADALGILHDAKFRNISGMYMIYQNVVFIATDGQQGMPNGSKRLRKAYEMMQNSPEAFQHILESFYSAYGEAQA